MPPADAQPQASVPSATSLDADGLDHLREGFLANNPDFAGNLRDDAFYHQDERDYKVELAELVREILPPGRFEGTWSAEDAQTFAADLRGVLTQALPGSGNRPQNLLNWRYFDFLTKMTDEEAIGFAGAVGDLLHGEGESPERLERFNAFFAPLAAEHGTSGPAITRSFPTLLLMLLAPEHDIYIRSDNFNALARLLLDLPLFRNEPLDAEQYLEALALSQALFETLEEWGWQPRDMIDVQSFIWRGTTYRPPDEDEDEGEAGETGDASGADAGERAADTDSGSFERLVDSLSEAGLYFPTELVANYLLALQAKRFVVLTGISGTGKTKLAQAVARHFRPVVERETDSAHGHATDHYAVIAVHPDWTDNRGLLGYHNPLTGGYVMTPFLRLLLRAREDADRAAIEDRAPHPYFVVLDEMNLARVEHYFADFLSCLESGEPLHLHDDPRVATGETEDGREIPMQLHVPPNLFFTGTVNIDETTYMFSPKVLDRAFAIELNTVDLDALGAVAQRSRAGAEGPLALRRLPAMPVQRSRPSTRDWRAFMDMSDEGLPELIGELNQRLAHFNRHFGYRVANEIARFVNLAAEQAGATPEALWAALDLAVLQKVLPKLHGTQQELQDVLEALFELALTGSESERRGLLAGGWHTWTLAGAGTRLVRETPGPARDAGEQPADGGDPEGSADGPASEAAQEPETAEPSSPDATSEPRLPRTATKLWRMLDRLRRQGFTSYIE